MSTHKPRGQHRPFWLIQAFDSTTKLYETKVDVDQITQNQMRALLMALTAKAGLTFDEIIRAYATRGTKIANDHRHIQKDGPYPTFTCGSNPHFVASIPAFRKRKEP